ncbi:hypothetical protein FCM35_KLT15195 [Carex littledalei]|uniref:Uncharacterized protein n=1 Tax=Carex littledalei TaxID=544730 RepID=A0A833QEB9_9POAL|nr:hypothetical protein FCM35_KLT15195 [Carex littledalei]
MAPTAAMLFLSYSQHKPAYTCSVTPSPSAFDSLSASALIQAKYMVRRLFSSEMPQPQIEKEKIKASLEEKFEESLQLSCWSL